MLSSNPLPWSRLLAVIGYLGSFGVAACAPAPNCCQSLLAALPSKVACDETAAYNASLLSYWAQGEQLINPSCVVLPQTAQDVSKAIKIVVNGSCKFAVRGGGHGSPTGIANIQDGVTIDLQGLNSTTVSSDNSQVSIGGGQHLGNVFTTLYSKGLYIPAARAAKIGAGGSSVGGGLGYFYPKYGFGTDSIVEFEVVLANGTIVSATQSKNSDLWLALRGGGSNFGIVTKLNYTTYPLGDIWGGDVVYPTSSIDANVKAFSDFGANPNYDENAAVMMNYHWAPADGDILDNQLVYAKPVVAPAAFSEFYAIPNQLANTTAITNIPAMSNAQAARSPDGYQEITFAVSYLNNVQVLREVFTLFNNTISQVQNVTGISYSLSFESLIQSMSAKSKAKGGDVLGVNPPSQGVVLTLLSLTFSNAADYAAMDKVADTLLSNIITSAKNHGATNSYIDMNHAKGSQKVLQSYGSGNYSFLQTTAKKYDPSGVFQKLMPGGFKL